MESSPYSCEYINSSWFSPGVFFVHACFSTQSDFGDFDHNREGIVEFFSSGLKVGLHLCLPL